jgi:predicted nucleic acid-binding protein
MSVLVDTNVLLRIAQVASADHQVAKQAITRLAEAGVPLCIVPQVIYEYWVVATRPVGSNGLGMDTAAAEHSVLALMRDYRIFRDERGVFGRWQALVVRHAVQGKTGHDARLVAAMQRHGLSRILTFNKPDFIRFAGIEVISPAEFLTGPDVP